MKKRILELFSKLFYTPKEYAVRLGVRLGKNCVIRTRFFGSEPYLISLGDNVVVTAGVRFFTHGAARMLRDVDPNFNFFGKIRVGNNVYIGQMVLIMPGVIIGDNVIIGAGAVVTKSIPDNVVVAGNPARIIGDYNSFREKNVKFNIPTKALGDKEKKKMILESSEDLFIKKGYLERKVKN